MKLSASDRLALIREYKAQGGKRHYLNVIKEYELGGEVEPTITPYSNTPPINMSPSPSPNLFPTQHKPEPPKYQLNKFLVKDRQNNILVGGLSPVYSEDKGTINPFVIGVGNKSFINPVADYGVKVGYSPSDRLQLNMGVAKSGISAGLKYKFEEGGEITQGIPYQAPTNQQIWQGTIPKQPVIQPKPLNFNYQPNIQKDVTNIPKVDPKVSGKKGYLPGESIKERADFSGNLLTHIAMTDNNSIAHGDWARYYGGYGLRGSGESGYGGKKNYNLQVSRYKPSTSTDKDVDYISNQDPEFKSQIVKYFSENYNGEPLRPNYASNPKNTKDRTSYKLFQDLGKFKISAGQDSLGDYISYYDKWNYSRNDNPDTDKTEWLGSVKPYEVYDRIYYTKTPKGKIVPKEIPKETFKQSWNRITKK